MKIKHSNTDITIFKQLINDIHINFRFFLFRFSFALNVFIFTVDLTNGQLTPNNNTPLLTQALSGEALLGIDMNFFLYSSTLISLHSKIISSICTEPNTAQPL